MAEVYNPLLRAPRKRRKRGALFVWFVVPSILGVVAWLGVMMWSARSSSKSEVEEAGTVLSAIAPAEQTTPKPTEPVQSRALQQVVEQALEGTGGEYAVVIKHLQTGEYFARGEGREFQAASLYKLWVMAAAYEQIAAGTVGENDTLKQSVVELNRKFQIASESAELTEGDVEMTVAGALREMIVISDNYAALLLTERIRLKSLATFLNKYDFDDSHVGTTGGPPTTTPADIARFFELLYRGQVIDREYSEKMLGHLRAQRLNHKIPANLPDEVMVAHKTGELDGYSHDAGIVYAPSGDYLLILMSESDNRDLANVRLQNISEAVYTYFQNTDH